METANITAAYRSCRLTYVVVLFFYLVERNDFLDPQTYIVYMGELPEEGISTVDEHHNLLQETIGK